MAVRRFVRVLPALKPWPTRQHGRDRPWRIGERLADGLDGRARDSSRLSPWNHPKPVRQAKQLTSRWVILWCRRAGSPVAESGQPSRRWMPLTHPRWRGGLLACAKRGPGRTAWAGLITLDGDLAPGLEAASGHRALGELVQATALMTAEPDSTVTADLLAVNRLERMEATGANRSRVARF